MVTVGYYMLYILYIYLVYIVYIGYLYNKCTAQPQSPVRGGRQMSIINLFK